RDGLRARERTYWQNSTPIGYVFTLGLVMGLIVGVVICYQVLATDVADHLPEFATLKAMGYGDAYLAGVVLKQALWLAVVGFVPVIRIEHLNHYFGEGDTRAQVLFDNSLEVMPGEIVIMTGPSGSGKTTLLTLVSGLRTVQEGSVQVLGRELRGLGPAGLIQLRRGIGFIFQAHNLFDSLTAYQNVRMAMELQDGT